MTYNQSQRSSERFKSDKIEPGTHVVFLGGIPAHVQSADVVQFLTEKFGAVEAFKMIMDNVTGKHKGYGFARFVSSEVAENARRLKFVEFQGKSINLGDAYTGGAYHSTGRRPATNVSATTRAENLSGSEYNQGVSGTNNNNNWYPGVNGTSPGAYVQPSMGVQSQANVNSVPNYPNHGMRQHMSGNPINGMNAPIPPTNNATSPQRRTVDICRYWSQGRCRKGVNCPFVHSMNENEWRSSMPPGTSMPSVPAHTMQMAAGSPAGAPMVYHGSWDGRAPVPNAMNNQQVITIPPSAHGGQHHHPGMGGYPNAYPTDVNSMPQHPPYYPYYGSGAPEAHPQNQAWATGYSYTSM